jgi:hypothetical protein
VRDMAYLDSERKVNIQAMSCIEGESSKYWLGH